MGFETSTPGRRPSLGGQPGAAPAGGAVATVLVCAAFGPVEALRLEERSVPAPGRGQAVVELRAAGLNFPDTLVINGTYQVKPKLPFVPGSEGAGIVAAVGEGVEDLATGDRVIVPRGPTFATRVLVEAADLIPIPRSMSFQQAAGFCVTYGTAYHALRQRAALQPGETLLVLGAAGGVGTAAIDVGEALGAKVIAAASTEEKLDFACRAGAALRIDYSTENLKESARELTAGRGVDVVFDPVGGELSEQAFRAIAKEGRFLVVGFASGDIPRIPLNLPLLKTGSLIGVWWGDWASRFPAANRRNFEALLGMVDTGRLRPPVPEVFPLENYVAAFRRLAERRACGKVVLEMKGNNQTPQRRP
jgi:NADPH2:quinone reductase